MKYASYRYTSVLLRVSETLDTFYMGQEIDWQYDVRTLLDQILELAMQLRHQGHKLCVLLFVW